MSAATYKPLNEASPIGASFSYAQAAKGRTPSLPSTVASGKPSESVDLSGRRVSVPEPKNTSVALTKTQTEEQVEKSHEAGEARFSAEPVPTPAGATEPNTKLAAPQLQSNLEGQSLVSASIPPSPSSGTASASTLPKEDEALSNTNDSSDSTWEKQSQGSQNGNKSSEKIEGDKEQNTVHAWDEEPTTSSVTSLKEAPPPAVNIWQHRKEMADAKAKTMQSANVQTHMTSNFIGGSGSLNSGSKTADSLDPRKQDSKKRGKIILGQSEEKYVASKEGIKLAEARSRSGEEVFEKGARRYSRTIDADKPMSAVVAPPPPPGDAMSWPTPDSAQGEEKKKAQERAEKGEKEKLPAAKPHGREKWMPVPYVPTAVFVTPLPSARRGGRAPRGGRDGGNRGASANHGTNGTEKPSAGPPDGFTSPVTANSIERGRAEPSSNKNNSTSSKPKRAASAGPSTGREQRKNADSTVADRPKEAGTGQPKTNSNSGPSATESRRTSTATQTDDTKIRRFSSTIASQQIGEPAHPSAKASQNMAERDDRYQNPHQENQTNTRTTGADRRNESSVRMSDNARDYHGHISNRERGEGRGDRGRANYRTRANHGYPNSSSQTNGQNFSHGHPSQNQASTPHQLPKSQNNHERHASQSQAALYNPSHSNSRNFRTGSRSQTLPHSATYSRFPNGANAPHPGAPPLSVQTDMANSYIYSSGQQGVMSAIPYSMWVEPYSLFSVVSSQMSYYFSVNNLCKDMFLRKHMDSQGFVFLSVVAGFNRIKQLTQEMELIRYACINSPHIEFRQGPDGVDRVRPREGWQQWVLNKEDRDPSAQNDGPVLAQQQPVLQFQSDFTQSSEDHSEVSKQFSPSSHTRDESILRLSNGVPRPFVPISATTTANGNMTEGPFTQTPLSAEVPDFTPAVSQLHDHGFSSVPNVQAASAFTDEQVENLTIVIRKPIIPSASNPSASPPFPSAPSRTFSNGSIDSRTIADALSKFEERQARPNTTEDGESDASESNKVPRSRSPFSLGSPYRQLTNNPSPIYWVKDKDTPIDSLPNGLTHESYQVFRRNALQQREHSMTGACHQDMDILYQFWSHFLIRNFNTRMYEEFRQIAFEDLAKQESTVGIRNLIQYYDESIHGSKVVSDEIARDFVDLVKNEALSKERPAFDKLRAAWRNGAFNLKNRKKIDNILGADLKAELER